MRSILAFLAFATSLPYIFADTAIAERSHKTDDGYSPIQIGVMMLDGKVRHAHRRRSESNDNSPPSPRSSRRDYAQSVGLLKQSPDGKICYPDEEGQDHGRSEAEKRDLSAFKGIITWYTGGDLLNPSCLPNGGWNPTDDSMIAAVTLNWFDKPPCGSFLSLRTSLKSSSPTSQVKTVVVRVMDTCAGCLPGIPHVDLTKAGFSALYGLDVGLVEGIEVKVLDGPPFKKWGAYETALYGPKKLG